MASNPQFTKTPLYAAALISAANTNRDGTGTVVSVLGPGANGGRIDRVVVKALGNTTAGMVRLFIHDGANTRPLTEIEVVAVTASASKAAFEAVVDLDLVLPTGHTLRASTHNAENFMVSVFGGDF